MKLIILFTKIDNHSDFNGEETVNVGEYLHYRDTQTRKRKGFHHRANHFCFISPGLKTSNNTFSFEDSPFDTIEVADSKIILIQLTDNLKKWSDEFKSDFIAYASNFDQVYISYHKGPNNGDDIRNGNHRLLEEILEDKEVFTTEEYQHIDNDNQLYAVLARAIVENEGVFTKDNYNALVDRLVSFIEPSTNDELELIHHCLTNVGTNSLSLKGEEYIRANVDQYEKLVKSNDGIKKIHKILNKKSMTL